MSEKKIFITKKIHIRISKKIDFSYYNIKKQDCSLEYQRTRLFILEYQKKKIFHFRISKNKIFHIRIAKKDFSYLNSKKRLFILE